MSRRLLRPSVVLAVGALGWLAVAARHSIGWLAAGGFALAFRPSEVTVGLWAFYWIWASHLLLAGVPVLAISLLVAKRLTGAAIALGVLATDQLFLHLGVLGSSEWLRAVWPQLGLCVMTLVIVANTVHQGRRQQRAS